MSIFCEISQHRPFTSAITRKTREKNSPGSCPECQENDFTIYNFFGLKIAAKDFFLRKKKIGSLISTDCHPHFTPGFYQSNTFVYFFLSPFDKMCALVMFQQVKLVGGGDSLTSHRTGLNYGRQQWLTEASLVQTLNGARPRSLVRWTPRWRVQQSGVEELSGE